MYTQHFNFAELPFSIAPNPRYVYLSPQHREALAHLLYGINTGGGFVVLTGEVGTGKTTLCRCLLEQLPEDVEIAVIFNPRLNSGELLAAICTELRISQPQHRSGLKLLIDLLNQHLLDVHARGNRTVVLIDEAQNLSFDVLEQIRLLTNLETNEAKLLQIILVGQPELNTLLQRRNLRQLAQRITARYHLRPLSLHETVAYIEHRIAVGGGKGHIFSTAAKIKIFRISAGIPRLINLICDRALLGAYALGKTQANCAIVRKAAAEVFPADAPKPYWRLGVAVAVSVLAVLAATFGYFNAIMEYAAATMAMKPPAIAVKPNGGMSTTQKADTAVQTVQAEQSRFNSIGKAALTPKDARLSQQQAAFADIVADSQFTRQAAIAGLFDLWHVALPSDNVDACKWAGRNGLRCLEQTGSWIQLRNLGLPAILEFENANGEKRYAIFAARYGDKVRLIKDERSYEVVVAEMLPFWRGAAMLLWKPPFNNVETLKRGDRGTGVKWLRQRLTAPTQPGLEDYFDVQLQEYVANFQKKHGLFPDGIVGALTFIHLTQQTQSVVASASGSSKQSINQ
ncbi:MAG: AAA family ATPase [Gammaproteobacteria bacterium]